MLRLRRAFLLSSSVGVTALVLLHQSRPHWRAERPATAARAMNPLQSLTTGLSNMLFAQVLGDFKSRAPAWEDLQAQLVSSDSSRD